MRFGIMTAATAILLASAPAEAATVITQSFNSTFTRYGSRGPIQIGGLNLVNQVITSAVVSYQAGQSISQSIFSQNPNDAGTFNFSGSSGFVIESFQPILPVPASVSVAFSGSNPCVRGICSGSNSISGDYVIPQGDLAAFAGTSYIQIYALFGITGNVAVNGGVLLQGRETYSYAAGTITYLVADVAPVPEPATWAMMILGMGAVGFAMRRRQKNVTTTVAYAA
ncbi:PEPxxWA-CTERM sorting domain-containing protein [Sphingomonas sp. A2-49]|uniref:PEPxxWA-CTERM sorting domain-containing protein n=1 Tax=Sphingomonas sp. A2-49 TaxID=1391375 RepID=UPI0021CF4FDD|nr:PEPxxWA-CTERM sorting domain-containing protein [Sphingomonas sp. A2-49]MCU6453925.1 PEPxxWA-CTERM sorting domain-containing protein [Sphingomonas sp. A2-49]